MQPQHYDTSNYNDRQDHIRELVISPALETLDNIYSDRNFWVNLRMDEFNSICPKTGLPDFAIITIRFIPDKYLVEEKSLKLYLNAYRNIGIFQENVTNKVQDDFIKIIQPKKLIIVSEWKSRGGISTTVETNWEK